MSELTREKIYKSELIKAGATGNNNLERIRSLAGGGTPKEEIKEIYEGIKEYLDLGPEADREKLSFYDDKNISDGSSEVQTIPLS